MGQSWKPEFKSADERRFNEQLEVLPPLAWVSKGFLVGEAWSHRECRVSGRYLATFKAHVHVGGRYFESMEGLTVVEWRELNPTTLTVEWS